MLQIRAFCRKSNRKTVKFNGIYFHFGGTEYSFISWLKEGMHQASSFAHHVPSLVFILKHIPEEKGKQ